MEEAKVALQTDPNFDRPLTEDEMEDCPFRPGEMFKWKGIWFSVSEITLRHLKLKAVENGRNRKV